MSKQVKNFTALLLITILFTGCMDQSGFGGIAYVSNEDSGMVTIVDLASMQVVDSIEAGKRPRGIRLSSDGNRLYVAVSGSPKCPPWMPEEECANQASDKSEDGIAEIDLKRRQKLRVLPGGSDPEQFDISEDGRLLFVSNEDVGLASVINLETGRILKQLTVGTEPEGVKISPDQKWVLVTNEADANVSVIETASLEVVAHIPVGSRPRDICFHPGKDLAYISNETNNSISVVNLANRAEVQTIQLPKGLLPMGLALDASRKRLYVATGRGRKIVAIDTELKSMVQEVVVGTRPWGIALTEDKRFLISANGPSNDISVVDTRNFEVIKTIPVGKNPWGVAIGR
jgi:YVTN family beta-propeller protein